MDSQGIDEKPHEDDITCVTIWVGERRFGEPMGIKERAVDVMQHVRPDFANVMHSVVALDVGILQGVHGTVKRSHPYVSALDS